MRQVIIRDDDTSFFTQVAQLEAIYTPLWERNLPVSLAVIPAPRADVRVRHRPGTPYDPSIPPHYRGQDRAFPLSENRALCDFLNHMARQGLIEVCLHGYHHTYLEFLSPNAMVLQQKLTDGLRLLHQALPDAPLQTFIAPYDRMSPAAIACVLDAGLNLCSTAMELAFIAPFEGISTYQMMRGEGGQKVFTCDEYLFTHRDVPENTLNTARLRLAREETFVCANHLWCFFHDWEASPRQDLFAAWSAFVDELVAATEVTITTFGKATMPR